MAREIETRGLDIKTRRGVGSRSFEDLRRGKHESISHHIVANHDKPVERSVSAKTFSERKLREEPPSKARLTVKEKKRKSVRTGISIAEE